MFQRGWRLVVIKNIVGHQLTPNNVIVRRLIFNGKKYLLLPSFPVQKPHVFGVIQQQHGAALFFAHAIIGTIWVIVIYWINIFSTLPLLKMAGPYKRHGQIKRIIDRSSSRLILIPTINVVENIIITLDFSSTTQYRVREIVVFDHLDLRLFYTN